MTRKKPAATPPRRLSTEPALFAVALRRRRRELGLTQIELGRFAGCGPDFIYDLEAGKPTIRLDKLVAVLEVLGLELRLADGKRGISVDPSLRGDGARSGGGPPPVRTPALRDVGRQPAPVLRGAPS